MTEETLQANTAFGEQVLAAQDNPTPEITIDGLPMGEFIAAERQAQARGQTLLTPDEIGGEKKSDLQLFREAPSPPPLFKEQPKETGPAPSIVANHAYVQTLATNDPRGYDQRKLASENTLVIDEYLKAMSNAQLKQSVADLGTLRPEAFKKLSPAEQIEIASRELRRLNLRRVSPRNFALMAAFLGGGGDMTVSQFESVYDTIPTTQLIKRKSWMETQFRQAGRRDIEQFVASKSFDGAVEILTNVAWQDMTPIIPLLTRWNLIDIVADAAGIENAKGWDSFWLGSGRQKLREGFISMSSSEFNAAAHAIVEFIDEEMKDPLKAALITKYGVLELFEAVFTEDVFDGVSADNKWDLYGGNVETLLEGLFSVMVMARVGKTAARAFTKSGEIASNNVARASGSPHVAGKMDEELQTDNLAIEFGLEADEAVPSVLPRPSMFIDDTQELPDGTKRVVERSERVRSELLESTDTLTGTQLTPVDRTNAVNRAINDLDLNDGAYVMGRMSTLQMLENGTGFNMRVVVGETAEGGYKNLTDALEEALSMDNTLELMTIMRVNAKGVLEPVFVDTRDALRFFTGESVDPKTAKKLASPDTPDESFYLTYDREQFWHPLDKEGFNAETFQSGGIVPRALLSPNAKFGDEIYGSFLRAYMGEQTILKNFDIMFEPYYKLGQEDKRFVASAFEWMEDFGKNNKRAPDVNEIRSHYVDMTDDQLSGIVAMRNGMDTLHELYNRRLFREWQALDFKTARPAQNQMPTYHGKVLDNGMAHGGEVLDPELGKMVKLSRAEIDDLYAHGGAIMKLDMPVDAANGARQKATRILLNRDKYEVGELSTRPLVHHPGYSMRFYDDPYYITKRTDGVAVDGSVRRGAESTVTEAVRTAGTKQEAERFRRKIQASDDKRGVQGVTYEVTRANDLSNTESTLFQKESIHRESRLFWDERNAERLPDVNGNRATLEDPVRALERGIGQAARELTHEDLLRSVKEAWKNDFGDLLSDPDMIRRFELKELSQRLSALKKNTVNDAHKARIRQAKELIDYMRLVEGTEGGLIPSMREATLDAAITVNRWTGMKSKRLEQLAMTMDPFRAMRSVAFNAFLVFRPIRQALLQSSQIGYLAALDPTYVASSRLFRDAYGLRRGMAALRKSGYDDGFSVKGFAKAMGISEKEYRVLLREFDRSGLIDLVDVHSFSGGVGRYKKTPLAKGDSPLGTVGYKARQYTRATRDWFQNVGFNFGERNNLTFTYNLALRRTMKRKKYDSLLEMTRKDWSDLKTEASNLALGMVRPNNFGYQTGAVGVATQFLSFGHKAMLGLLGANPAIKGTDAVRIALGTYLVYGADMFGARDFVAGQLQNIGMTDQEIPGTKGMTVVDLVSGGLVDNMFNMIGDYSVEDWKDVDMAFIAPGIDFPRMWDMQLRNVFEQPTKIVFGAFGNIASNVLTSLDLVEFIHTGDPDLDPADKFMRSAMVLTSAALPLVNDNVKAYYGYKMGLWYSAANEAMPLRTTMNGLIARAAFGARTKEELAYYGTQRAFWEAEDDYNSAVMGTRKVIKQYTTLFFDDQISGEKLKTVLGGMINLYEDMPEGVRLQFLQDVMDGVVKDGKQVDQSIFAMIVEKALLNPRVDPQVANDLLDRLGLPPDQLAQLKQLTKDAYDRRVNVDARAQEELQNGN